MKIFFETDRLIVKIPTLNHFDLVHALETDHHVMQYIGNGSVSSPERTLTKLKKDIAHFTHHHFGTGLLFEKATDTFIGQGGLTYLEYDDNQPDIELDYLLHRKFWGKGYALEVAKKSIEWGFAHLPVKKLIAVIDPPNIKSQAVVEKAALNFVGERWCYHKRVKWYEIKKSI